MNGQIGSYPRGIAATAAVDPDRIALIDGSRRVTFGELDALANGIADRLAEHGVGAGDAVGILLHNRAEWFMITPRHRPTRGDVCADLTPAHPFGGGLHRRPTRR